MLKENRFKFDKTGDPLIDKVTEAFIVFPFNPNYIDQIVDEVALDADAGVDLLQYLDDGDGSPEFVELRIRDFARFTKGYHVHDDYYDDTVKSTEYVCTCTFYSEDDFIEEPKDFKFKSSDKKEIDFICQCLIPYFLTSGSNKDYIPLLVNIMPDLSQYIYMVGKTNEQDTED